MRQGKYCKPHNQWVPEGDCPWCEPEPPPALVVVSPFAAAYQRRQDSMKKALAQGLYGQQQASQQGGGLGSTTAPQQAWTPPPQTLPVASCKHDGVLYMYGTTTACAACGKVLSAPAASLSMLPVAHYTFCPLKGPVDAGDLANGCVCVPFP